jgi:hypothetical protein
MEVKHHSLEGIMRCIPTRWLTAVSAATLGVFAATACNDKAAPTGLSAGPDFVLSDFGPGDGQPEPEELELCKFGSSATFDMDMSQPSPPGPTSLTMTLLDATDNLARCRVVGEFDDLRPADITITEVLASLPLGVGFDSVRYIAVHGTSGNPGGWVIDPPVNSTTNLFSWSAAGHDIGFVVEFYNSARPGGGGGQGCTLGYWKQSQHFDSWESYTPDQLFSSVFEDAFPGKTLLDVLNLGSGGLDALGRQTVAALLNASSSGENYDLTVTQVIDAFNGVFPGSKAAYTTQKDIFEGFNTKGCPLN